jgi:hypothetical protein
MSLSLEVFLKNRDPHIEDRGVPCLVTHGVGEDRSIAGRCANCLKPLVIAPVLKTTTRKCLALLRRAGWMVDARGERATCFACIATALKRRPDDGPTYQERVHYADAVETMLASGEKRVDDFFAKVGTEFAAKGQPVPFKRFPLPAQIKESCMSEQPQTKPAEKSNGATPPTPESVVEKLTLVQKKQIRIALDEHFDDEAGKWLEGWSDQQIARDVGCGWAAVKLVREEFYGVLKEDTEIVELRLDLEKLRGRVADLKPLNLDEWIKEMQNKVAEFEAWKKETAEWRDTVKTEVQTFKNAYGKLMAEVDRLSVALAKIEKRNG